VEKMGVERSRKAMDQADLVLAVVDLDSSWDEQDQRILGRGDKGRWIVVGSKSDLVDDPGRRLEELEAFVWEALSTDCGGKRTECEEISMCAVSAVTGEGIDELRALVHEVITGQGKIHVEEAVLANERQRGLVEAASESVSAALSGLAQGKGEELVCEDIRNAARALGAITGEDLTADLLDEIFSRFCLGK
jgi:tRNA modification GTPase